MSTIGGLSTSTSSSIRGYGGLASGLDRDTLIEGMTSGTTSKITQQQQKKQQLEWKQAAVQNITNQLLDFANKYTSSWSSKTNLFSSMLWGRNVITPSGANSSKVSITGTASAADAITIMGVKQMAKNAKWTSAEAVSDQKITTGKVGENSEVSVSALVGETLNFEYSGKEYSITLGLTNSEGEFYDYKTASGIAKAINDQLSKVSTEDNKELSKIVSVSAGSGNQINFESSDSVGITLRGGTVLNKLGLDGKENVNIRKDSPLVGSVFNDIPDSKYMVQDLAGKTLSFKYGDQSYSIMLGLTDSEGKLYDYRTADGIAKAIEDHLKQVSVNDNTKLSNLISVSNDSGKIKFSGTGGGNILQLTGGTATGLLGFESPKDGEGKDTAWDITTGQAVSKEAIDSTRLTHEISFAEKIAGKTITFSYNGTSKTFRMPGIGDEDGQIKANATPADSLETIRKSLQDQMDAAFGKNRIDVSIKGGKLSFQTYDPSTVKRDEDGKILESYEEKDQDGKVVIKKPAFDKTSTLTLESGNSDLIGANGVLGINPGVSNRVNMDAKLADAGLGLNATDFSGGSKEITINGVKIEITADDTMNSLIKKVNESAADVTISYQSVGDKFTFTSKQNGGSGSVNISGDYDFLNKVFGVKEGSTGVTVDNTSAPSTATLSIQGQDAVIAVKYAGSDDPVELIRDSNTFNVDGLTINVKGEFGYDKTGNLDLAAEPIEINAQVDADSIVDAVKAMVDEYNAMIESVNKQLTTKPDRDYAPLTSEQKKELSDDEIEAWEKKAKEGLLYADSDIRSLSSDLRFIIGGGIAQELSEMGISTSSTYSDNGKLTFDETKFRAALSSNPERVQQLFAESFVTNTNGKGTSTGIATALKNVMDKYVNTMGSMESKGILIRKAGSESAPMSITENTMYKQLQEINDMITKLQERLETERDRYIKQFTSLETLISQMNSQSSFLSQLGGY